jgi:putative phage-type endonuclease
MKILNFEQLSPEWHAIRLGRPSASKFDMIVTADGSPSKQRQKYLYQLAGEKVSGISPETYQNDAMLRGIELESEARKFYEIVTENVVTQVGFCLSDCEKYGASPDGMIGEEGLLEIKCPIISTHVGYLLTNKIPTEYYQQTQGQLLVTGRKWVDFVSYYPGIKPLILRSVRDEGFIYLLKNELERFCKELEEVTDKIK